MVIETFKRKQIYEYKHILDRYMSVKNKFRKYIYRIYCNVLSFYFSDRFNNVILLKIKLNVYLDLLLILNVYK